jgi:hypothetical protein
VRVELWILGKFIVFYKIYYHKLFFVFIRSHGCPRLMMLASSISRYPVLGNDLQEVHETVLTVLEHASISQEMNLSSELTSMMAAIKIVEEGQVVVVGMTDNKVMRQRLSVRDQSLLSDFNHKSRLQELRKDFESGVVVSSLSDKKAFHEGTTHIYSSKIRSLDSKTLELLSDLVMITFDYWRDDWPFQARVSELKLFLSLLYSLKSSGVLTRKTVVLIPNPVFEGKADRNKFYAKVEREFEFYPLSRQHCSFFKAGDAYIRTVTSSDYYNLEIVNQGNFGCIHDLNNIQLNTWRTVDNVMEPDFWVLRMKFAWQ